VKCTISGNLVSNDWSIRDRGTAIKFSVTCPASYRSVFSTSALILSSLCSGAALAEAVERRHFLPEDVQRIQGVSDIALSPDGEWVCYRVATIDADEDKNLSDLFMVNQDGSNRIQLTRSEERSEEHPRFSPDGKYLAFIAAPTGDDKNESDNPADKAQVWLLNRSGGEAERLTALPGGVSDFEWSPDSQRLVLVGMDPEKNNNEIQLDSTASAKPEQTKNKTPKPIVINRYRFKQDGFGYLVERYKRLYVFDLATRDATLLTTGAYDSVEPAWGPDSNVIAFSSRRQGDPDRHVNSDIYVIEATANAIAQQLTTWEGADSKPVFSPDGRQIAYIQGGAPKYALYDPGQIAVVPIKGGTPLLPTEKLDRHIGSVRWSANGKALYFLATDDRVRTLQQVTLGNGHLKRIFPAIQTPGVVQSFEVGRKGAVAVVSFGQLPAEVYRTSDSVPITAHNSALLEDIEWASVVGFESIGKDGVKIGSMLLKPPGFRDGVAYPTIVYVHGGPVSQDGYEFDITSQALAAQGYLVVNPNYRGSSGRGREFSRAIYADWGNLEVQDIHAVIDQLVKDGLADPERLGIGGWSYGGMNTNYAIATDTRFAAAFSGASISNMITGYGTDQYTRLYESELGLPWQSIDTYLKISYPFFHADRIKTPTLFMCGERDFNVPLINSEQMYQALRSMNVPTELVIYPGQNHRLRQPSYIVDRLNRMLEWYGKYLGTTSG
jgi:dipeptidyl aminopeptidase/acylaminoacyl peptidase